MTGRNCLAIDDGTTTLGYLAGPGRRKPESGTTRSDPLSDLHLRAAQGRPDAIEALLRQLRPAIAAHKVADAARASARSPPASTPDPPEGHARRP